ncbi:MAG: GNAT family N-acetyltransferase [Lachnospiraceae bacterium]|nr:GNAT family N-acetyltransferase [Lachnospiraceae bacterium]
MSFKIVPLPKDQWAGTPIPMGYTTKEYYDVVITRQENGFTMTMEKKRFDTPVTHTPEEYDFPDKLYEEHWTGAYAWGVIENGELIATIETDPENWSNRLRVTELWVAPEYQKQGLGHALMEIAKEQARIENRRAIILETQSCNVNAIGFYLHEGFTLIGFDSCCYASNDLERKEVRIELGYFLS